MSLSNNLPPFLILASALFYEPFYSYPSILLTEMFAFISLSNNLPFLLTSISTYFDKVPAGTETSEDFD